MGGGVTGDGAPASSVRKRIRFIRSILNPKSDVCLISSSFSLNLPPLVKDSRVISEASAAYQFALQNGFEEKSVFVEQFSHDTIGSLFFCLRLFTFIRPSLSYEIVTSDFHIDRARVIAEHILSLTQRLEVEVNFHSVQDETVDSLKRREHEADAKRAYLQQWSWIRDERTYLQELVTNILITITFMALTIKRLI